MASETWIEALVTVIDEKRVKADVWFLTKHRDNFFVWYQIGHDEQVDRGEEPEHYETREEVRARWREIAILAR